MARRVKDAKDLSTNELIFFKGHAKATYMSDGKSVEDAITLKQDVIEDLEAIREAAMREFPDIPKSCELVWELPSDPVEDVLYLLYAPYAYGSAWRYTLQPYMYGVNEGWMQVTQYEKGSLYDTIKGIAKARFTDDEKKKLEGIEDGAQKHVPSDWNASLYKEGHIKNRTHHMQDYMCVELKGSPMKIDKPYDVGYVLLTYDTDMAEKYIPIEIKASEYKTYEFLDATGLPIIFTWDNGNSTINVQTFGGAIETYSIRAYYSPYAESFDHYFIPLNEGFIPKEIVRKRDLATINGKPITNGGNIVIEGGEGGSYDDTELKEAIALRNIGSIDVEGSAEAPEVPNVGYDDSKIQAKLTELSAEIGKKQDALISGESIKTINGQSLLGKGNIELEGKDDVFVAIFGETKYQEVVEAYNKHQHVMCIYENTLYSLFKLTPNSNAVFTGINDLYTYRLICQTDNVWYTTIKEMETIGNKVTTLSSASTNTQYPSAKAVYDFVNNAIGNVINGEY